MEMEPEIVAFDTHDFVKRLTGAGMPEAQAEVLAGEQSRLIQERLATKSNLRALELALKNDLEKVQAELQHEFQEHKAANQQALKELELNLKHEIETFKAELKHDIKAMEQKLTIRLGAMLAIGVTVLAVLDKLL